MLLSGLLASVLLAGCAGNGVPDPGTCRIDRVADLPMLSGTRLPAVRATLEGEPVVFYIDTGAQSSMLTRSTADHFNFRGSDQRMGLGGIGGVVNAPVVVVDRLDLGRGIARDITLPVAGNLGPPVQGLPVAGLFGADFLSNYDVDMDLPDHRFALYDLRRCHAPLRPFDGVAFELPFRLEDTRIGLQVRLNGQPIQAVLDSGASVTLVTLDDAHRAGVTAQMLEADRRMLAVGIDEGRVPANRHLFDTLEVGDETMHNYRFAVAEVDHTLIGDEFFRANHIWISYSRRLLFVQPRPH